MYIPEPSPPEVKNQGLRPYCHMAAISLLGFSGSITKSAHPVESFTKRVLFQVSPPSIDLNTPRSGFGPQAEPKLATYISLLFLGFNIIL